MPSSSTPSSVSVRRSHLEVTLGGRTYVVQSEILVKANNQHGFVFFDDQPISAVDGDEVNFAHVTAIARSLLNFVSDGGYFVEFCSQVERLKSVSYAGGSGRTLVDAWSDASDPDGSSGR